MLKKLSALLLVLIMITMSAACGTKGGSETTAPASEKGSETTAPIPEKESETSAPAPEKSDSEIIETVLGEFDLLTKIPRPSHHEKQISDFIVGWATDQGFSPVQDEVYNVMFDVPAVEGCENLPLCILQGHMDMVVAVEDGKVFDPLKDTVTVIRDEKTNTLTAEGTSLGGDDGAGVAIMMAAAQGKMKHGPLRMLITVDEEDGMEGAFNMDASWLDGAAFLINIDNESSDEVLVSTAAGDSVRVSKQVGLKDPAGDTPLVLALTGLQGGHSGIEINKGRMNGLIGLANFLKELENGGINFELASFSGGTANNAIPAKGECTIVVSAEDRAAVEELAAGYLEQEKKAYAGIDDSMALTVTDADALPQVISGEEKANLIRFITEIIDGVYTWSADMEGLVESSSNLGLFSLEGENLSGGSYIRSSVAERETEILQAQLELAEKCGYQAQTVKMADPWPYNPDSRLLKLAKEIYLEQNGKEIVVSAVHAGLECGTFATLDPGLDMISIGPDLSDPHTERETLYLDSIPKVWRLLEGILIRIGE